ncbi:MAG: V-type ATP synthase subunit D [Chlamydiae bacterium CG10_big_fil_rev_8_21_14_0_10_35_9]|nr:MAG: V-type ATP synthase subunit D [Chlamydiae bacterium CG10_big_fil_rev_8_21_14_0_10_35_9]
MTQIKLTKAELRTQQIKLNQLERYLPTLQLKKAMLQLEINQASIELEKSQNELNKQKKAAEEFSSLLSEKVSCNPIFLSQVKQVYKDYENIAGVEIPTFQGVDFLNPEYFLFETPVWTDSVVNKIKSMIGAKEKLNIVHEKKRALEQELREVSIRVNLFEKVLIPRSKENIKKIKIFLGDQQLAEIAQAKVAKAKINAKKEV